LDPGSEWRLHRTWFERSAMADLLGDDFAITCKDTLTYSLRKDKLREATRREGRYLLRSNLSADDPARIWRLYMLLVQVEEAFRNLKGDLSVRPIHHQLDHRIEAHIFISFLAFCLHATLRHKLRLKAPGLTPRSMIEQMSGIQMLDVHFPTTDGRTLIFNRYTMPDKIQKLLIDQLNLELPPQSPPRITSAKTLEPLI
jgi:transposase